MRQSNEKYLLSLRSVFRAGAAGVRLPEIGCALRACTRKFPSRPQGISTETSACKRSEEHTSELQSRSDLVCRLLLEKKKNNQSLPIRSPKHTYELQSRSNQGYRSPVTPQGQTTPHVHCDCKSSPDVRPERQLEHTSA